MSETAQPHRSIFERIEEWFFKLPRWDPFNVVSEAVDETTRFKAYVSNLKCPGCTKQDALEVKKFERGSKGWEADIECKNCNFKATINSAATIMLNVNSIGRAREK